MKHFKHLCMLFAAMLLSINVWGGTSGTYTLVTGSLSAGDVVIIVNNANTKAISGISTTSTKYGTLADVTESNGTIVLSNSSVEEFTVEAGSSTGAFSFKGTSSISNYLYWTSGNSLNQNATKDAKTSWTVSIADGVATIKNCNDATRVMRFNSDRFACYTSNTGTLVRIYKKSTSGGSENPTVSAVQMPAACEFVGSKSITLTCETEGASIYYTLDGNDPTSASTLYNEAFIITETTTVKAIAFKDATNSSVSSATYTKVTALTTMDEIFAAATTAGSTATSKVITFDNWVISGVKGNNAYLTDNNGKGLIIYGSGHGFVVGDILSGTATCNVQLYNGSAELTALTSNTGGLTVNKGGSLAVQEIAVADLSGANTGAVIKLENVSYTQDGTKYYFGDLQAYWNLMSAPASMTVGAKYNVTGVYVQYNAVKEIMPRTEADVEAAASDVTLTSIAISGTATKTEYFVGDAFDKVGLTVTATYSDATTLDVTSSVEWSFDPAALDNTSITTVNVTATFNEVSSEAYSVAITVASAPLKVTWDLSKDETASASADVLSWTSDYATMSNAKGTGTAANNYYPGTSGKTYSSTRFYQNNKLTIAPVDGYVIDKVEFTATSNDYATAFKGSTWTNASAEVSSALVTITPTDGETAISATVGGTCGFKSVVVYYHAGATKYNVVEVLNGCTAVEGNVKKFVDGTDELTLYYNLTDGYIWPENITVKVGETTLDPENADYLWETADELGSLEIAYEMHDNLTITIAATAKEVASIAVKTAPTKVDYFVGDNFEPAGLVITATYNDESTADIAYADAAADFSFAPALDAALALADANVVITYNGKTCNQAISVTKAPLKATWVASEQGYTNQQSVTSVVIKSSAINAEFEDGVYYNTGTAVRIYGGKTFTISAIKGFSIAKIEISSPESGDGSKAISASVGTLEGNTWLGEATSVVFTAETGSGHRRIAGITVYYTGEPETPTGIVLNTESVKKEFAFGETFNSDNLVVEAVYSDESKEDVTILAEVVAPAMNVAGNANVTVNYLTFSETYQITIAEPTVVESITLDETSLTVRVDKTAKLTATVAPAEAVDKSLAWESSDEDVVTVDGNGNLTPVAVGVATITVKSVAVPTVSATCEVTIVAAPVTKNYYLIKDASVLRAGDVIVLGCAAKEKVAAEIESGKDFLASVDATFNNGVCSTAEALEFVLGKDGDNWTLTSTQGKLGATAVKKMTTDESKNNYAGTWTIAISAEGVATITSTGSNYGAIKYNASSPRFLNYASGQTDIEIYCTVKREILRENLTVGAIGTYCAAKDVDYYEGATFYVPEFKTMTADLPTAVSFVEVTTLQAGHAYIYVANAATITGVVSGEPATVAVTNEALVGTLEADGIYPSITENYTIYVIANGELRPVAPGANLHVSKGKAYLNMGALDEEGGATPAPGRRIVLGTQGSNTATGLDNVEGNANVQKVLVNGNIYILRGEKMFNINGQLVK